MIFLNSVGWLGSAGSLFSSTWCQVRKHTRLRSVGSSAGAGISTRTSLSGVSAGGAEMAGGLAGPLSPAGFLLIHDDFIQSFISRLDV